MTTARRVPAYVLLAVALLLAHPHDTLARPRPTCVTIRADETVASVAKRITGDARNMQAAWFQVVNPTTSRWVPKARYDLRFAGWSACIMEQAPLNAPLLNTAVLTLAAAAPSPQSGPPVTAAVSGSDFIPLTNARFVRWGPVVVWCSIVLLFSLTYWLVDEYLVARADTMRAMKRFAERFVEEFERPLIQHHLPDRPIRSRVRFKPGRSRFDVLLAPQAGLRYPNLTDHKRNVMYDVVRIQQALSEHAFVSSRPYAKGRWVVVPFRFRETREAGGK
jgi:hypothetical protein